MVISKTNIVATLFAIVMAIMMLPNISASFGGGDGSSGSPYIITNWTSLNETRLHLGDTHYYTLNNSLSSSTVDYIGLGDSWTPMGIFTGAFIFNGNNKIISDVIVNAPATSSVGLFSTVQYATIYNLSLTNESIIGSAYCGGLAGRWLGQIYNITTSGRISCSGNYAGGIIGNLDGDAAPYRGLHDSSSSANVYNSGTATGGLVGGLGASTIRNSYFTGTVTSTGASGFVGGLIGYQLANGILNNSYAIISNITATGARTGGLVGYSEGGWINNSYTIINGFILGTTEVGSLVGYMHTIPYVHSSYAIVNMSAVIRGTSNVGIIGWKTNAVANTYMILRETTYGNITYFNWLANVTTGNLIGNVSIINNSIFINTSAQPNMNQPANITIANVPTNYRFPQIFKDGVKCGTDCYNFTSLSAGIVKFNVTGFSNYSIVDDVISPILNLTGPANNSFSNTSANNFTVNISDTGGIRNATIVVMINSTGAIVNQTTTTFGPGIFQTMFGTMLTLADNIYAWFYTAMDYATNSNSTANFTLIIDTTNPVVNVTAPNLVIPFLNINTNISLNFTASDLWLDDCWFIYGGITRFITCGSNYSMNITEPLNRTVTFYANDTLNHVSSSSKTWSYGILYNDTIYTANVTETQTSNFYTTFASTIGLSGVSLFYNGSEYPAVITTSTANISIDIPTGIGNKNFFWRFYYSGLSSDSPIYNQTIYGLNMSICNSTSSNVSFLNISFKDSVNMSNYDAGIILNSKYYMGTGISYKTLSFINNTVNTYYGLCAAPNTTIKTENTFTYAGVQYPTRTITNTLTLTNITTNLTLWGVNSSSGQLDLFTFTDAESGAVIKDISIDIKEQASGIAVSNGLTDSLGKYYAWVNPTLVHNITASKTGCITESWSFIPSSTSYSLTLSCGSVIPNADFGSDYLEGITYHKFPGSGPLSMGQHLFEYDVRAVNGNIQKAMFQLTNETNGVVVSVEKTIGNPGCNATLCYMNATYNVSMNLKGGYYVDLGYGYQALETDTWYVVFNNSNVQSGVAVGLFKDLVNFFNDDLTDWNGNPSDPQKVNFTRIIIMLLVGILAAGGINRLLGYDMAFPGSMTIFIGLYVLICSYFGLFYLTGFYTGTTAIANFMNQYIVFIMTLFSVGPYIMATNRRNTQ